MNHKAPQLDDPLTDRQLEVLKLLAVDATNGEIAKQLYLGINTVKTHIQKLFVKLGATSRLEAVFIAQRKGIIPCACGALTQQRGDAMMRAQGTTDRWD